MWLKIYKQVKTMANSLDIKCDNPSHLKKYGVLFEIHLRYKYTNNKWTNSIDTFYLFTQLRKSLFASVSMFTEN